MKIDCLNKRTKSTKLYGNSHGAKPFSKNELSAGNFVSVRDEMAEVMDSNAVELWGCFEIVKDKLLQYKNGGGDTIFAESALEDIMVYAENSAYVNKPYIEEKLNAYIKERENI